VARARTLSRAKSRRVAAAYYRAVVAGRVLEVVARRHGVSASTLRTHGQLWPEHLSRLVRSTTLRPWERERLNNYLEKAQ
jgi:transposase-like protein